MKGKAKNKRKIGKVILIGMGFFLTIILTFTTTLAWFYDSDWASKYVQMGGSVGIKITDGYTGDPPAPHFTSGAGNLHFNITTDLAYPGQAVDVSASCYNDGGRSGNPGGSKCYVRAHFAVYTNIGNDEAPNPENYPNGVNDSDYKKDLEEYNNNRLLSAESLYAFLNSLISAQNSNNDIPYYWQYYQRTTGAMPLSISGTDSGDIKYYLEGDKYDTLEGAPNSDKGYFYLCIKDQDKNPTKKLKKLGVGDDATFLWNSTFVIPWQLTNVSAGKYIFVGVTFQAIQTFIPKINAGVIDGSADNQLEETNCEFDNPSVQTVFNSCKFTEIDTTIMVNGNPINFAGSGFTSCDTPTP